jgi:protein-disulfide isomerase
MKFKGFFAFLILSSFLHFSPSFCEEKNKGKEFIHSEIRDYLLNNPEVILESLKRYERKITNLDSDSEQSLVDSQFVELTQDRFSYVGGNKNGSINIVAFFDYKCGYCKRANAELSELILENKDVRFILKEFPILGQESLIAAQASIVVLMDQGDNVYKAFTDKILTHSGNISIKTIRTLLESVGGDSTDIESKMKRKTVSTIINANYNLAKKLNINGTPTFIIGRNIVRGYRDKNKLQELINKIKQDL